MSLKTNSATFSPQGTLKMKKGARWDSKAQLLTPSTQ